MPTIDELAPAPAASDTDEIPVSQSGTTRKVSRLQLVAGLQPQMSLSSGVLLGRASPGVGAPETISIGDNLHFASGTLAATAAPYLISSLPRGTVPGGSDLIGMSQGGTSVAVSYTQFISGLAGPQNLDITNATLIPAGSSTSVNVLSFLSGYLPLAGGTISGLLTLSSNPISAGHAATKAYVDSQLSSVLPKTGGSMAGNLLLASDPVVGIQASTKNYVDSQFSASLAKTGGTLSGPLTLYSDPSSLYQAATKGYVDQRVLRAGDTLTGYLSLANDPALPAHATTKNYVDGQLSSVVTRSGGTLTGALLLAGDPTVPLQAATKSYTDARLARSGDTMLGSLMLSADPTASMQAATKGYVDTQMGASLPRAGGSLSGPLLLSSDPTLPLHAATKQYTDQRLAKAGDTLTGILVLSGDPTTSLQAASKNYVDKQVATALPTTGGTLSGYLTLGADPTVPTHAATKRYVDGAVSGFLALSGGSLTGALSIPVVPTAAAHATSKQYVDGKVGSFLPISGGSLSGTLSLAGPPVQPLDAATKRYVDANPGSNGVLNVKLPPFGAAMDGVTDDTAAFAAAYQAAAAGATIYVPNGVTAVQPSGNWGVSLSKRVKWVVDGTTLPDGTSLADAIPTGAGPASVILPGIVLGNTVRGHTASQGGSQATDLAVLHSSYIVNHNGGVTGSVVTNVRADTIIYNSPNDYVWGGLDRLIWAGVQTPSSATPAQHVGRYVQTLRQAVGLGTGGTALPQPAMWAACLEYRDTSGYASSWTNASITVEMDWIGNGPDDAKTRQVQSLVIGQHNTSGAPVEISSVIGVYLAAGSSGRAYTVFNVGIPFSTAVLDTTGSQQLTGAAAIRLAAGHLIAFEPTVSYRLGFDSSANVLRWYQPDYSYVVGKGISVGWKNVFSAGGTLTASMAGNMIFLTGNSAYTINLPPATSLAPGTGFTFSVTGSGAVSLVPSGSDGIDLAPITLRTNDRYHIVSDGSSSWREVFRTNMTNPKFAGPPVVPTYTVAILPSTPTAGSVAFASNGRKPGEPAGAGTGVQVFGDGMHWISVCSGTTVTS